MDHDQPIVVSPEMIVYPKGLNSAMEGLAREIILTNPKDLYAFAANYFEKLIDIRKKTAVNGKFFEIEDIVKHKIDLTKYGQEEEIKPIEYIGKLPSQDHTFLNKSVDQPIKEVVDEKIYEEESENNQTENGTTSLEEKELSLTKQLTFDLMPKEDVENEIISQPNDKLQNIAQDNSKNEDNKDLSVIALQEIDQTSQIDEKRDSSEKIPSLDQNKEDNLTPTAVDNETIDEPVKISSEENVSKVKDENAENQTNTGNKKDEQIPEQIEKDPKVLSAELIENEISNIGSGLPEQEDVNKEFIRQESKLRLVDDKSPELVDDVFLPSEISKVESQKSKSADDNTEKLNEVSHSYEEPSPKEDKLEELIITEDENIQITETPITDPVETAVDEIANKEDNPTAEQKISSDEITTMGQDNDIINKDDYTSENQRVMSLDAEEESNDFNEEYNKDEDKKPSLQKEISFQELTDIANIVQDLIVSEGVGSTQSSEEKPEIVKVGSMTDSEKIPDVNDTSITDHVTSSTAEKNDEPPPQKSPEEIINDELNPEEIPKCDDTERCDVENKDGNSQEMTKENTEQPNVSLEGDNLETHAINGQVPFSVKTSLKSDEGDKHKLFEKASIMIQKVFRGFMVRSKLSKKKLEKSITKTDSFGQAEEHEVESANTLINTNDSLCAVPEEKADSSDESSTFSSAATKIQAGVRGFLTRKSFQQNKTDNSSDTTAPSIGEDSRSFEDNDDTITKMIIATTSIIIDQLEHFDKIEKRSSKGSLSNIDSIDVGGEEKRKRLKREDAIQMQSPFSSGENPTPKQELKANEDDENMGDLAKNIILDIVKTNYETVEKPKKKRKWVPPETDYGVYIPLRDYSESVESNEDFPIQPIEPLKITEVFDEPAIESTIKIPELIKNLSIASDDGDVIIAPVSARSSKSSQSQANLRTFSSAERERVEKDDKVSPLPSENPEPNIRSDSLVTMNSNEEQEDKEKESTSLLHSGEFHDMVLPTRVERKPTSSQKDEMS